MIYKQTPNRKINECVSCRSSVITEADALKENGNYPIYGATGIISFAPYYQINEDAIIIIKDGAGVGKVQYGVGKFSVIGTQNYLTAKFSINLKYVFYCLKFMNFERYKVGSGIPHIYFKDYGEASIYCPSIEEQNRIECLLSYVDEKIKNERKILLAYKMNKKYLTDRLFI